MPASPAYGLVILAAGNSSRLGQPKQLLPYGDKSLVFHIAEEAIQVADTFTVIVCGAEKDAVKEALGQLQVHTVYNEQWPEGMASSIRTGLSASLTLHPELAGCIFTVCDQPFVSAALLSQLISAKKVSGKGIAAATYAGTMGTPVLFDKKYFPALLQLKGAHGAKKLLQQYPEDITGVSFPAGEVDIDTPEDYNRLLAKLS